MQSLPPELSEQVLLRANSSTLISLCGTSPQYRNLCSDSLFWKKRFKQEGLPLLEQVSPSSEQGTSAQSWIRIYQNSRRVAQLVEDYLERDNQNISFEQINLDELSKIAPEVVRSYIQEGHELEQLLEEKSLLEQEDSPLKDALDDIDAAIQTIPEYFITVRWEGTKTYALDIVLYTPLDREYDYLNILHGLSSDKAFNLLFNLLY
ncbi:F-box domain-containing protein [Cedratvirus kamchatka]|uniref:F-box domain-containing protein n=1 Tax=Cedratvirus kamchatka TaxID=2716914 RepID=A0A6G8MY57_9VIRU|nr:F-box domain-containing protein [Cedratvirus kamchatka]WIL04343.1 F-box domain-containing protein [Cedratvirus lena]WIL04581.1 F-box domain-containing protein [Cedratvirus duvanny]